MKNNALPKFSTRRVEGTANVELCSVVAREEYEKDLPKTAFVSGVSSGILQLESPQLFNMSQSCGSWPGAA